MERRFYVFQTGITLLGEASVTVATIKLSDKALVIGSQPILLDEAQWLSRFP